MDSEIKTAFDQIIEWIQTLETKVQTINDRTKRHTLDIMELRRWIKELQK